MPLLIVLCNNRQYASQTWNVFKYCPDGVAVRKGNFVGNVIQPTPDYVKFAEAYGGSGQRVQKADLLRPALRRALEAVASGQTFLLDVITNPLSTSRASIPFIAARIEGLHCGWSSSWLSA
jgi:acetolactate synthase-1/2/3 large subunit